MVTLKHQYDNTEVYQTFGSTQVVANIEKGTVCLILETQGNLGARILLPTGRVGWLPLGWLTPALSGSVAVHHGE